MDLKVRLFHYSSNSIQKVSGTKVLLKFCIFFDSYVPRKAWEQLEQNFRGFLPQSRYSRARTHFGWWYNGADSLDLSKKLESVVFHALRWIRREVFLADSHKSLQSLKEKRQENEVGSHIMKISHWVKSFILLVLDLFPGPLWLCCDFSILEHLSELMWKLMNNIICWHLQQIWHVTSEYPSPSLIYISTHFPTDTYILNNK